MDIYFNSSGRGVGLDAKATMCVPTFERCIHIQSGDWKTKQLKGYKEQENQITKSYNESENKITERL